jgi:hypothetical protein
MCVGLLVGHRYIHICVHCRSSVVCCILCRYQSKCFAVAGVALLATGLCATRALENAETLCGSEQLACLDRASKCIRVLPRPRWQQWEVEAAVAAGNEGGGGARGEDRQRANWGGYVQHDDLQQC